MASLSVKRYIYDSLIIETGRYRIHKIPYNERFCLLCYSSVENEHHALFECTLYEDIRMKYNSLLDKYSWSDDILNPNCVSDAEMLGSLLLEIESVRCKCGLEFTAVV